MKNDLYGMEVGLSSYGGRQYDHPCRKTMPLNAPQRTERVNVWNQEP